MFSEYREIGMQIAEDYRSRKDRGSNWAPPESQLPTHGVYFKLDFHIWGNWNSEGIRNPDRKHHLYKNGPSGILTVGILRLPFANGGGRAALCVGPYVGIAGIPAMPEIGTAQR